MEARRAQRKRENTLCPLGLCGSPRSRTRQTWQAQDKHLPAMEMDEVLRILASFEKHKLDYALGPCQAKIVLLSLNATIRAHASGGAAAPDRVRSRVGWVATQWTAQKALLRLGPIPPSA